MDYRFPKWLRFVVNKLNFLAVPNLGSLLAGIAVVAFFANMISPAPIENFLFDPVRIRFYGEWWRVITVPFMAGFRSPLGLLFYCMYCFYVVGAIEAHWGAGPLTLFLLLCYVCAAAAALILMVPLDLSIPILGNMTLLLGTLMPHFEMSIYFILPIKAKWLALFTGGLLLVQFLTAPVWEVRVYYLVAFLPYLLFFSPWLIQIVRSQWKQSRDRKKFDRNMWR